MAFDNEIVQDFIQESESLTNECIDLLEDLESNVSEFKKLDSVGNKIDRIMGTAQNVQILYPEVKNFILISDYAAICKVVAYKATAIQNNLPFVSVVVSFLIDAVETLQTLIVKCESPIQDLKAQFNPAFIDRLKWISEKFTDEYKGSVGLGRGGLNQTNIDDLLKKLGI